MMTPFLPMRNATGVAKIPYCRDNFQRSWRTKGKAIPCSVAFFVLLGIAASDHEDGKPIIAVLAMQPYQLRCQLVTRPTLRVREHQKQLLPAELLERDGLTLDIRQIEIRRRSAGLETFTLDAAFTERKLSKCGLLRLLAFCGFPRESDHCRHPCSQTLRHLSLLVQQICRRRAAVFEHLLA